MKHLESASPVTTCQTQWRQEVHQGLGTQAAEQTPLSAAQLSQGSIAHLGIARRGELLDGKDGRRGHQQDKADVDGQIRDQEADRHRLLADFSRRQAVGTVGFLGPIGNLVIHLLYQIRRNIWIGELDVHLYSLREALFGQLCGDRIWYHQNAAVLTYCRNREPLRHRLSNRTKLDAPKGELGIR